MSLEDTDFADDSRSANWGDEPPKVYVVNLLKDFAEKYTNHHYQKAVCRLICHAKALADEAAHDVIHPREFHENVGGRQQRLSLRVVGVRLALQDLGTPLPDPSTSGEVEGSDLVERLWEAVGLAECIVEHLDNPDVRDGAVSWFESHVRSLHADSAPDALGRALSVPAVVDEEAAQ